MTINPAAATPKTNTAGDTSSSTKATTSGGGFSAVLSQTQDKAKAQQQKELKQTCQQLEGFLVQQLLESMDKTIPESDFLPKSSGHDIWQSMLNEQYATTMSQSGSLGISDMIYKQLSQGTAQSSNPKPAVITPTNRPSTINQSSSKKTSDHPLNVSQGSARTYSTPGGSGSGSGSSTTNASIAAMVDASARKYNLPSRLVSSVIEAESGFDNSSLSPTGAAGLMQLMPGTAASLGVKDVWNPQENIDGGCRYLKQMLDRYNGNISLALAAYNAGPGSVDKYGGVPPYAETQAYVRRILSSYAGK